MVFIKKIIGHPTTDSYSYGFNTACFTGHKEDWRMVLKHKTRQATISRQIR